MAIKRTKAAPVSTPGAKPMYPENGKMRCTSFKLTELQFQALRVLGGAAWVRQQIDKATAKW